MKVELIHFTGKDTPNEKRYAAELLAFTKSTRLEMTPGLMGQISDWSNERLTEELEYMATTIPSSWEFVDVTFLISGVSRAAAQQITRTRTASFAMQSQRVVDMSNAEFVNPYADGTVGEKIFGQACQTSLHHYHAMLNHDATPQDARGVLPLATCCNLVAKYNLRSFVNLIRARSSLRAQGEYSDVADEMKRLLLEVWPWADSFFRSPHDSAIAMLEDVANRIGLETGHGDAWQIAKAIDLLRK